MRRTKLVVLFVCALPVIPAAGHEIDVALRVVIDTDMGIDDAVTLSLALQCPQIRITGVVACEGVAGPDSGVRALGRMLEEFNRGDVALYGPLPAASARPVPHFRDFAESTIDQALCGTPRAPLPFTAKAYTAPRAAKVTVLALGPLTNLAAALKDGEVRQAIAGIVIPGAPDAAKNWNLGYDPDAFAAVAGSGVALQFIETGSAAAKPDAWRTEEGPKGRGTTVGEGLVARLFATPGFRGHYTQGAFAQFTDELALIACVNHDLFAAVDLPAGGGTCLQPRDREAIASCVGRLLSEGRQAKNRVVFAPGALPDSILRADVRKRKAGILAKNGESEWFAQLLMNELHEHLGSYSIIGVKMGLHAAELLNAPPHGMQVVSHSAAQPPVSCLNDGIIVSTGSTPGRALFRHEPGPAGSTRVSFSCNGRQLTLAVKDEYRKKVQASIDELRKIHTLEDAAYWQGVRGASLEIWEHWHRRDLFEIERSPAP